MLIIEFCKDCILTRSYFHRALLVEAYRPINNPSRASHHFGGSYFNGDSPGGKGSTLQEESR